ncbi:hypothetical protein [Mycobacterium haemophilum]|uniref:Uncharacterized protein n=1 Tax=Mycobacterium haemophilum TaxID=29311 RepID=A0A0I9UYI0_9MYCO|nr:hypothetical protein [Mycobacterium haemophilum]KLO27359.1 hypothetical protein ABH39_15975 [Mycobacterium haemophilum]KLO35058.1 hypothetical protein ABH38_17150 [Mycobacterium haemophilum]KLO40003.1 hypothetical protein ABH37_17260 [Mycobacterium haemophilum]KLO47333.1 hypothetical protein ABH36_17080 [Mycobacterium haemophilum]
MTLITRRFAWVGAFRLAGLAGRDGLAAVMVTSGVRQAARTHYTWGDGEKVKIKGRRGIETIFRLSPASPTRQVRPVKPTTTRDGPSLT